MSGPRIGELFSGYGGLGIGVQSVYGGTIAWHSDIDKGACKILAHRYPEVPNLGDITTVEWVPTCGAYEFNGCGRKATVLPDHSGWECHHCQMLWPTPLGKVYWPHVPEPVDILTGGSPCQDLSHAGRRAGMTDGTRSNLWVAMREAIAQLRPAVVVWENVRGAYSAAADSAVESCAGCVGDGSGVHLRALGRVLGDLSDLGYDCRWHGLRAADVGAPHGRFRVFVVATDAQRGGRDGGAPIPQRGTVGRTAAAWGGEGTRMLPTPTTRDHKGRNQRGDDTCLTGALLPTPRASDGVKGGPNQRGSSGDLMLPAAIQPAHWGAYSAAVRGWEQVFRPAPSPAETGPKGGVRLSPLFSEWLMGLPAGWVTDVPGITRNEALKALGNGVVPQQCAEALRLMASWEVAA